ncbi:uncharacterized protein LOC124395856 isoform X1 [Silurus meridionalis]|uniref:uncharacterized protein LOC124395856 isoform X1 n=1 Tax=Silurus meridionalis TaxID=175797 RepID=UPI001EEB7430|nr:uncharacterized protein LOC124395856 isoform X1 [Silurus meridionalis]
MNIQKIPEHLNEKRGRSAESESSSKGLLEDIVSTLWELETARRRQERLVLGVLEGGNTEKKQESFWKWQQKQLPNAPGGVMWVLQQQLSEMTMNSNTADNLDSVSSSGYEQSESQSSIRHSRSSPSLSFYNHRGRSVEDAYMLDWEGQRARPLRSFLPRSYSAPYPPLEGIAEGIEDAEDDENEASCQVNEPKMGTIMNLNEDGSSIGAYCEAQGPIVEVDEGPTEEDLQLAMRVETYILDLLQRYCVNQTSTATEVLGSSPDHWQELYAYPHNYCEQPESAEWQQLEFFNDEVTLQDRCYLGNEDNEFTQACKDPCSSIESSTVITDLDQHRHYHHPCISSPLPSEAPKQDWELPSLELAHRLPSTRIYQEESWSSVGQRHERATSQFLSEDSFQSQGFTTKPDYRYHTLGCDMDMHCINEDYMYNQRLWSSTADLRRKENPALFRAEEQFNLPRQISPHSFIKYPEKDHRIENGTIARGTQGHGSDSSLSETCSPGSSSSSSDSDESGGLVWPQQVPPGVPSFSQNAATAMVRIKASHALKKKILRFRSGSLKVMTTV